MFLIGHILLESLFFNICTIFDKTMLHSTTSTEITFHSFEM